MNERTKRGDREVNGRNKNLHEIKNQKKSNNRPSNRFAVINKYLYNLHTETNFVVFIDVKQ